MRTSDLPGCRRSWISESVACFVNIRRDDDHRDRRRDLSDALVRLETVHHGHIDVRRDHVRPQFLADE
jgi:hypothetical protein